MYFWAYGLRKALLDKCLKSLDSEDPSTSKMGNGLKHGCNINDSTFTIFIDPFKKIRVEKVSLSDRENFWTVF